MIFPVLFVVILLFIAFVILLIRGTSAKKIMSENNVKVNFNQFWTRSDNSGTDLISVNNSHMQIYPFKRLPFNIEIEKIEMTKLIKIMQAEVIDYNQMQLTVNEILWDILLFNIKTKTGQLQVSLFGFPNIRYKNKGICIKSTINLNDGDDFSNYYFDYENVLGIFKILS